MSEPSTQGRATNALAIRAKESGRVEDYHALWAASAGVVNLYIKRRCRAGISLDTCDEIRSESYEAMLRAVENYEPWRGSFTTVFTWHLRAAEIRVRNASHVVSASFRRNADGEYQPVDYSPITLANLDGREKNPVAIAERKELVATVRRALLSLSPFQREVIVGQFNLDGHGQKTCRDVAESRGVSRSRTGQVKTDAIKRLKRSRILRAYMGEIAA